MAASMLRMGDPILYRLARLMGRRLYAPNSAWYDNCEFLEAAGRFPDGRDLAHDRRFNLYFLARAFAHVPGDIAECGLFRGRTAHLLLTAAPGKHLHGFDSFEGLSQPAAEDAGGWTEGSFSAGEATVRRNLRGLESRYTLYRGWIPERFGDVADTSFSIVHVDVDLYEPTLDSFRFFWPRLNPGGIIICDDYGSIHCPGARRAVDEFAASVGQKPAELTTIQAFLVKPCT